MFAEDLSLNWNRRGKATAKAVYKPGLPVYNYSFADKCATFSTFGGDGCG